MLMQELRVIVQLIFGSGCNYMHYKPYIFMHKQTKEGNMVCTSLGIVQRYRMNVKNDVLNVWGHLTSKKKKSLKKLMD